MSRPNEPNYELWDSVNRFDETEATCLWAGFEPSMEASQHPRVLDIKRRFEEARADDRLYPEIEKKSGCNGKLNYQLWYWRQDLIQHANNNQEQPPFLFPEKRIALSLLIENDKIPIKKREQQIQAIEEFVKELGYDPLDIPRGGKTKIKEKCMGKRIDIFGTGKDPFLAAWQEALHQSRIRTKDHEKYSSK